MIEQDVSRAATGTDRPQFMPDGNSDFAQGLLLMRASAMKVVRLQLAMQRQDRALAMQTMDDLIALDSTIRHFVADIPGAEELEAMQCALDDERSALNREKFGLTAGMVRRGDECEAQPSRTRDADRPTSSGITAIVPATEYPDLAEQPPAPGWLWVWMLLGFALAFALAAVLFLFAGSDVAQPIFDGLFAKGIGQ